MPQAQTEAGPGGLPLAGSRGRAPGLSSWDTAELRQRHREGQEDRLGALGLAVNVIAPWDAIHMDAALNRLRAEGFDVRAEDAARLSPLGSGHVDMPGRHAFVLPDQVARGELRPSRDLRDTNDGS